MVGGVGNVEDAAIDSDRQTQERDGLNVVEGLCVEGLRVGLRDAA